METFLSDTRTSTRSEAFSLLLVICLDATKFLFVSVFFSNRDDLRKIWSTSLSKIAKTPLPFGIRHSKTSFLKLPTTCMLTLPFSDFESLKSKRLSLDNINQPMITFIIH